MKTFKQFQEDTYNFRTPKMYENPTGKFTDMIRTPDVIKQGVDDFRKVTKFNLPIDIVKKKKKINTKMA